MAPPFVHFAFALGAGASAPPSAATGAGAALAVLLASAFCFAAGLAAADAFSLRFLVPLFGGADLSPLGARGAADPR